MTPLSQTILQSYQIRKTKTQKLAFIELLKSHFPQLTIQSGGFPKCRNIIIGDIEKAEIILSAHYDTCAQLPFPNFIAPKNPLLSIGYSILITLPVIAAAFLFNCILNIIGCNYWLNCCYSLIAWLVLLLMFFTGPANKHTANDNTSGVSVLCELLGTLDQTTQSKVAFVFFDHEESGLIGASFFRKKFKSQLKNKLLINFDCVSDGDYILVIANKQARIQFGQKLKNAFLPTADKNILFSSAEKTFYPSDQAVFPVSVAIAALKRKRFIGYYLDRIHTHKDTEFDKRNIKLICDSILRLLKQISLD